MLEIFTHSGGLRLLAHLFPQRHMLLRQQSSSAVPHCYFLLSLQAHSCPPILTFCLVVCLSPKQYGQIICSNTVLGATEDGE